MLTLQQIKEDPARVIARLAVKGFDGKQGVNDVIDFDEERKNLQFQSDNIASTLKKKADSIGRLMKEGRRDEAEEAKKEVAELKEQQKQLNDRLATTEKAIRDILLGMPNIPCDAVPEGKTAEDNVVEKTGGPMPDLSDDALPHWDLAKKYNLIDFELGVKITGPGFPVYLGKGAKLQRALIQFFLDRASEAGYLEVQPPYVVNEASGYGTGQLPDKEGQMYYVNEDNLYL
ncbi:MAG: serine--tRNA ligase, partial [Duncaniella sp.]|nr:serine--tRNA ligase [Duncaniella sp.]